MLCVLLAFALGAGCNDPAAKAAPGAASARSVVVSAATPASGLPSSSASASATTPPLDPARVSAVLGAVRADPLPAVLVKGTHYFVSNELRTHVWSHAFAQQPALGGMMIGVGTEQNLLLAGWLRPDLLVLMDFDQVVVDLNAVHLAAVAASDTPTAFLEAWRAPGAPSIRAQLEREGVRTSERVELLKNSRALLANRFQFWLTEHDKRGIKHAFADAAQYETLRRLVLGRRVLTVRGDLTGGRTMKDLGKAARELGVPVRALYLSNAEDYFPYWTGFFRENLAALPFDERSVVLHTLARDKVHYWYVVQPATHFVGWARGGRVRNFGDLFAWSKAANLGGADDWDLRRIDAPADTTEVPPASMRR